MVFYVWIMTYLAGFDIWHPPISILGALSYLAEKSDLAEKSGLCWKSGLRSDKVQTVIVFIKKGGNLITVTLV